MGLELSFQNRIASKKVRVNDLDVAPEEFVSFNMNISLFEDKQYCTLILKEVGNDFSGVNQGSKLEFYLKDRIGNEYLEEEFVVISVTKTLVKDTSTPIMYHIEFVDKIHFDMLNTYESHYFKDQIATDIIKKIVEVHDNGTTKWNISTTEYVYPQWLAPQNINQAKVLRKTAIENSLFFYRGLEHYSMKTYEDMIADVLPEEVKLTLTEGEDLFKMVEVDVTVFDSFESIRRAPASNLYSMDALDKKVVKTPHLHTDLVEEVKVNDVVAYQPLTLEGKEATRSGLTTLKENRLKLSNQKEIINNTALKVVIDGDMRIEPGKVIDTSITRKRSPDEDLTISGHYLVIEVSNNFVGNHYYQELLLTRV